MDTILKNVKGLSGSALKLIAVAGMAADHLGSILLKAAVVPYAPSGFFLPAPEMPLLIRHSVQLRALCEVIGSIAFPLFCFLLAEGFVHTRDPLRYGVRLGIFALISEVPYDLARFGVPWTPRLQNVMFTLCVSAFTLLLLRGAAERTAARPGERRVLAALGVLGGMGAAWLLRGEYVFLGVLAVSLLYLLRERPRARLLGLCPLLLVSPWVLLALVPLSLYNGTRGRGPKYFFYLFYPAHFLLLAAAARWLAGG